jgi:hypothetical protein
MKRILIIAIAAGIGAGCDGVLPTEYERHAVGSALQASLADPAATTNRDHARGLLDDVAERIIPALSDATAARQLGAAFGALRSAIANVDERAIPQQLRAARHAVDLYGRVDEDAADLAAIRLALDLVEAAFATVDSEA